MAYTRDSDAGIAPMTKVSIVSDLHLEFGDITLPGGDILLMCGDTLTAAHLEPNKTDEGSRKARKRFIRFAKEEMPKYDRVIEIAGNHTFYHTSIERAFEVERAFWAEHAPNVTFLENESIMIDGVCFIGTTLWSTCGVGRPMDELRIGGGLNDFRLIRTDRPLPEGYIRNLDPWPRRFTVHDANALHQEAIAYLEKTLAFTREQGIPVVVVGHHAPSFRSKIEGGRSYDNGMDEAYYSHQDALIKDNPHIYAWLHGHSHDSCSYKIGATRVISNQRGYKGERSDLRFNPTAADFELEDARLSVEETCGWA